MILFSITRISAGLIAAGDFVLRSLLARILALKAVASVIKPLVTLDFYKPILPTTNDSCAYITIYAPSYLYSTTDLRRVL